MASMLPMHRRTVTMEWILVVIAAAAVGWTYLHDKTAPHAFCSPNPDGYYGLLTEAIPAGQVNLNIVADVKFLKLANPYAGPQDTIRPHDMSYYKGKFYIYYGITPVLILMLPWLIATGTFLTEAAAVGLFCYGGFLLGTWWLVRFRQRQLPNVSPWLTAFVVLVWGWGTPVLFVSQHHTFYAVPITAAFFCLMAVVVLATQALESTTPRRSLCWLSAASLMHGLSVGARPDYVLSLPCLVFPAWLVWRYQLQGQKSRRAILSVAAATVIPAAFVGLGLAYYNYIRFENPFDFGIRFSLASGDLRKAQFVGLKFIPHHLWLYLFHAAEFFRYFPFVYNDTEPFGFVPHFTLGALAALAPAALFVRRIRRDRGWTGSSLLLLGATLANLGLLCFFFGGVERYLVDFIPPALLLAASLVLWCADRTVVNAASLRAVLLLFLTGVSLWTLGNGLGFWLRLQAAYPFSARLEWIGNSCSYAIERFLGAASYGPVQMEVKFPSFAQLPKDPVLARDPILTTGYLRGSGDIIYAIYPDAGHVQFGYFHLGAGGPVSEPIPIERGHRYKLSVYLGSLYPPARHPLFRSWTDAQIKALRRHLEIRLDGRRVMQASVSTYPSTPSGVMPGRNLLASDVCWRRFRGELHILPRLPFPASQAFISPDITGPVRIRLRLPAFRSENFQPLICTGRTGAGDLLNVQYRPDGTLGFQHDCWGQKTYYSPVVRPTPSPVQVIDVEMGSFYPSSARVIKHRLIIRLNGKLVCDLERPFHPLRSHETVFGYNEIGGGSAQGMFSGTILSVTPITERTLTSDNSRSSR